MIDASSQFIETHPIAAKLIFQCSKLQKLQVAHCLDPHLLQPGFRHFAHAWNTSDNQLRSRPVSRKIRRHEDGLWTQAFSANCRHSGMDAEASGLVRSSTNDGPIASPRHDYGFAT